MDNNLNVVSTTVSMGISAQRSLAISSAFTSTSLNRRESRR